MELLGGIPPTNAQPSALVPWSTSHPHRWWSRAPAQRGACSPAPPRTSGTPSGWVSSRLRSGEQGIFPPEGATVMSPCWSGEITVPIEPRQGRREWAPPPASPVASGVLAAWALERNWASERTRHHDEQPCPPAPGLGICKALWEYSHDSLRSPSPNLPGRRPSHPCFTVDKTGAQRAEETHPDGWKPQFSDLHNGDGALGFQEACVGCMRRVGVVAPRGWDRRQEQDPPRAPVRRPLPPPPKPRVSHRKCPPAYTSQGGISSLPS